MCSWLSYGTVWLDCVSSCCGLTKINQDYLTVLPCRLSQTTQDYRKNCAQVCTFTVYISCSVMASGDDRNSQPSGKTFCCEMRISWDPPKTYIDFTSPGVVVLDTTVVPDVVGLYAFDDKAALVQVLPGDFPNIVGVLVPDDRAAPRGLHDLLIEDLSSTEARHVRPASAADLTKLRQQWPLSLLTGMTRREVDMESLRWGCKREFGNSRPRGQPPTGNTSLSRHIMTFHLDLGQLWRCPIPWCSVWKGTTQDCVEHLRLRHYADSYVVASKLGKYFPPWTVTREAWTAAFGPKVSGIATDVISSTRCPACSLVSCVLWQSTSPVITWILHGEALSLHPSGLYRSPLSSQT